jgi:hypothetical protein
MVPLAELFDRKPRVLKAVEENSAGTLPSRRSRKSIGLVEKQSSQNPPYQIRENRWLILKNGMKPHNAGLQLRRAISIQAERNKVT